MFISLRGNCQGCNAATENQIQTAIEALDQGFDVMLDVWLDGSDGDLYLGTNEPQHLVKIQHLMDKRIWCRARNGGALKLLLESGRVHCFWLDPNQTYALTSNGYIWAAKQAECLGHRCVIDWMDGYESKLPSHAIICSEKVAFLKLQKMATKKQQMHRRDTQIQLLVFDLDGVLVDSKNIHYHALNLALSEVDKEYCIQRSEQDTIYEGLSTKQKLVLLTKLKGLPESDHDKVWKRKQEITEDLMQTSVKTDPRIQKVICSLKVMGYSLCVASNCIRSSVTKLLSSIGVLPLLDRTLSADDVPLPKPAPDIYKKCGEIFGIPPHKTLVIEDSNHGRQAAITAGCHLLPVETPRDVTLKHISEAIIRIDEICRLPLTYIVIVFKSIDPFLTKVGNSTLLDRYFRGFLPHFFRDSESPLDDCLYNQTVMVVLPQQAKIIQADRQIYAALGYQPTQIVYKDEAAMTQMSVAEIALEVLNSPTVTANPVVVADATSMIFWSKHQQNAIINMINSTSDATIVTLTQTHDPEPISVMVEDGFVRSISRSCSSHKPSPFHAMEVQCWSDATKFCQVARKTISESRMQPQSLSQVARAAVLEGFVVTHMPAAFGWSLTDNRLDPLHLDLVKKMSELAINGEEGSFAEEEKSANSQLTVLIPMVLSAQEISSFVNAGFDCPKPLAQIGGKPLIQIVLDNISCCGQANYIAVVRREHEDMFKISHTLKLTRPDITIVFAEGQTQGAAMTALLAKTLIDHSNPLLIVNADQYLEWNPTAFLATIQRPDADGVVVTFDISKESNDTRFSYVEVGADGLITKVAEKEVISDKATTGLYFWKKGSDFVQAAEEMIERKESVGGVYYIAPAYNTAIRNNKKILAFNVEHLWPLRVPSDFELFWRFNTAKLLPQISANHRKVTATMLRDRGVRQSTIPQLDEIYSEMTARNDKNIAANGFNIDEALKCGAHGDDRRCLAVYTILDTTNTCMTDSFSALLHELTEQFSNQVIYDLHASGPKVQFNTKGDRPLLGQLHTTFLQLIKFGEFDGHVDDKMIQLLQSCLPSAIQAFKIQFTGVIAVSSGLLMVGFPTQDVNAARENVRKVFADHGCPIKEPYKNDIVHATLLRLCSPVDAVSTEALKALAAKYSDCDLGVANVNGMHVSAASWRMRVEELPPHHQRPNICI